MHDAHLEAAHTTWQVEIAAGLLAHESKARRWTPLAGYDLRWVNRKGRARFGGSSAIFGFSTVQPTSRSDLLQRVSDGAAAAGLTLKKVWIWSLLGHLAVEITVETDDPTQLLADRYHELRTLTSGIDNGGKNANPLAEGTYVLVRDQTTGRWVTISAYATRLYSGVGGTNPYFPGG